MKYLTILMIGLATLVGTSCGDDNDDVPECIDALAVTLEPNFCDVGADLTLWEFNGREVYCFNYGTCPDSGVVIYEADCTRLCTLFGISGNTQCEGIEWDGNAQLVRTIYTF